MAKRTRFIGSCPKCGHVIDVVTTANGHHQDPNKRTDSPDSID